MKNDIEQYLDTIGEFGSTSRLVAINNLNLGERSEAAKRVMWKRSDRVEFMNYGMTFEEACIIVNNRNYE